MWEVQTAESGSLLLDFLANQTNLSKRQLRKLIENNQCQIDGVLERFPRAYLTTGSKVVLHQYTDTQQSSLETLYEDDSLLILNKPSGVVSKSDLFSNYYMTHRLDRQTSGVWVWAKTSRASESILEQFRQRTIKKHYLALVDGIIEAEAGTIENCLGVLHRIHRQKIMGETPNGKQAVTEWEVLKRHDDRTLVSCYPRTGRTHQIRVHMAGLGHPILGDYQYGKDFLYQGPVPRLLLHAYEIILRHPITLEELKISSRPPGPF